MVQGQKDCPSTDNRWEQTLNSDSSASAWREKPSICESGHGQDGRARAHLSSMMISGWPRERIRTRVALSRYRQRWHSGWSVQVEGDILSDTLRTPGQGGHWKRSIRNPTSLPPAACSRCHQSLFKCMFLPREQQAAGQLRQHVCQLEETSGREVQSLLHRSSRDSGNAQGGRWASNKLIRKLTPCVKKINTELPDAQFSESHDSWSEVLRIEV